MIEKLLEYQKLDRARLELIRRIEGGRTRMEINAANRTMNDAKANLLALEEDAKALLQKYDEVSAALKRVTEEVKIFESMRVPQKEADIQSAAESANTVLSRANALGAELEKISKQILQKTKIFEDSKTAAMRAQGLVKTLTPKYIAEQDSIKPEMEKIEKQMAAVGAGIDKNLLEKYKNRRKTESAGKITDIVVPVVAGRCGGCNFEMSNLLIHKIATDGYVVCEECQKILYKGK